MPYYEIEYAFDSILDGLSESDLVSSSDYEDFDGDCDFGSESEFYETDIEVLKSANEDRDWEAVKDEIVQSYHDYIDGVKELFNAT